MGSYIHFIRHGITEGNRKKWYYGAADLHLSKEGIEEIEQLNKQNIYPDADDADCYTTPLIRAKETFDLIYGNHLYKILPGFQEMRYGDFEMKSREDLADDPAYQEWMADATRTTRPPGGESVVEFRARVREQYEELVGMHRLKDLSVRHNKKDAVSIVVCHGGVIGSIMMDVFPGSRKNFWRWIPKPGRGYTLRMEKGKVLDHGEI
ncbi:MAG: histidine phosphatase family protein [Eubacteriaceae bacterium]|nr:histidine phosphatase family protein [Eubacteriaceae bacterium]